jgi:hypothetical protein
MGELLTRLCDVPRSKFCRTTARLCNRTLSNLSPPRYNIARETSPERPSAAKAGPCSVSPLQRDPDRLAGAVFGE